MDDFKLKMDRFNMEMSKIPYLGKAAEKANVPPGAIVVVGIVVSVILVALDLSIGSLLVQVIGVAYPCFKSILALESKRTDDDKQWLTYWFIYGLFILVE